MFIENLKMKLGLDNEYDIQCGYEAGCLGYSLYNQLTAAGVKCVILAPTTMLTPQGHCYKCGVTSYCPNYSKKSNFLLCKNTITDLIHHIAPR